MKSIDVGTLLSSLIDEPSRLIGVVIATLLFAAAVLWSKKNNAISDITVESDTKTPKLKADAPKSINDKASIQPADDGKLRDVFSVKQKPIVTGNGGNKQASSDRPFESSYYFAHNKHSTG